MTVLVTGFGAFPGVERNPTEDLVRRLDGMEVDGVRIVGRVLPVSFARGPALALAEATACGASLVVCLGVATSRAGVCVERYGHRALHGMPDVDGACPVVVADGPERVAATLDVVGLARALGATLSEDAGGYVCNATLYALAQALDVPVGFVHVPAEGIDPERLLAGIHGILRRPSEP